MGLLQRKQTMTKKAPIDEGKDLVHRLFDEYFREELRTYGKVYFERVINENAALFKQDLDATIAHVNTELKQHMARQLDQRLAEINKTHDHLRDHIKQQLDNQLEEYSSTVKQAQDAALLALEKSVKELQDHQEQLRISLEKSVAGQDAVMTKVFKENETRMAAMKEVQDMAVEALNRSSQLLKDQHQQLNAALQKNVLYQEEILVNGFQENMARVIEHYLLSALGEQFDVKAQLPSIIKQMDANKQELMDDMKL